MRGTRRQAFGLDLHVASGLLAGAVLAIASPRAPSWLPAAFVRALGILLAWRAPRWRAAAALLFGLGWTWLVAAQAMQQRLPPALEGVDLDVRGRVLGPGRAELEIAQPWNCRFEEGGLRGMLEAFGAANVRIEHAPCMRDGAPSCVLKAAWSPEDAGA